MKSRLPGCLLIVGLLILLGLNGGVAYRLSTMSRPPVPIPAPAPAVETVPQRITIDGSLTLLSPGGRGPVPVPPTPAVQLENGVYYPPINPPPMAQVETLADMLPKGSDTRQLAILYQFVAAKIEADGQRPSPGLRTLTEATALIESEKKALLADTSLRSLKQLNPKAATLVGERFVALLDSLRARSGDKLTPEARVELVVFLRELQAGFENAGRTGNDAHATPSS